MKRICLFAAYNTEERIREYVFDYLEELSKYATIYYMADNDIDLSKKNPDINRLFLYCKDIFFVRHQKYDFGSYSELAHKYVGWNIIEEYDELIFANDSCMCVQSFSQVFNKMTNIQTDAWGLLATDERNYEYFYSFTEYLKIPSSKVPFFCINSYFLAFRKNVFLDKEFRSFIESVKNEKDRLEVCIKYEVGLTHLLKRKFTTSLFIEIIHRNVIIYDEAGIRLLKHGFPLVKVKTFTGNPLGVKNLYKIPEMVRSITNNSDLKRYAIKYKLIGGDGKKMLNYKQSGDFILFFNVAADTIGGGMLSINRFIERTIDLFQGKSTEIILSGVPTSNPTVHYSMFNSVLPMVHWKLITQCISPKKLLIHMPEYYLPKFIELLTEDEKDWLTKIPFLHINIMDQNHDFFPSRDYFEICKSFTDKVTITTAHTQYTTQEIAEQVECPVKLLTPFLPKFYRRPHSEKEKIIAISPDYFIFDGVSKRDEALDYLKNNLPDYEIVIINNISIEEYKHLISKALFTITFGEGYDGYFIEPFLSDSVSFAVYNETFFPPIFKNAPTVYSSYSEFISKITTDIRILERDPVFYKRINISTEQLIKQITNDDISLKNLIDFYADKFEHIPEICKYIGYYQAL